MTLISLKHLDKKTQFHNIATEVALKSFYIQKNCQMILESNTVQNTSALRERWNKLVAGLVQNQH